MYGIYHVYDVDGGFGDAVEKKDLVALCFNKEVAEQFVAKYSNEHVYDQPYCALMCGKLIVKDLGQLPIIDADDLEYRPSLGSWADSSLNGYVDEFYEQEQSWEK